MVGNPPVGVQDQGKRLDVEIDVFSKRKPKKRRFNPTDNPIPHKSYQAYWLPDNGYVFDTATIPPMDSSNTVCFASDEQGPDGLPAFLFGVPDGAPETRDEAHAWMAMHQDLSLGAAFIETAPAREATPREIVPVSLSGTQSSPSPLLDATQHYTFDGSIVFEN
jgi:hypothetical protein